MKKLTPLIFGLIILFAFAIKNNIITATVSHECVNCSKQQVLRQPEFSSSFIASIAEKQEQLEESIQENIKTFKTKKKSPYLFITLGIMAFLFGVFHALAPGTGKTVMFSYFISHKEKPWRVPIMSAQIAFTHIISSIALVLITDVSIKHITKTPAEQIFWLQAISYSIIIVIGLYMFYQKCLSFVKKENNTCSCCGHNHPTSLALAVGLVPCFGTLLIMLYAMANQVLFLGIFIVFLKALGITFTLSVIGFLTMYARNKAEKFSKEGKEGKKSIFIEIIEFLGPILIIISGIYLLHTIL